MSNDQDQYRVTASELLQFIEQLEQHNAEIASIKTLSKDTLIEAKSRGYDTKIIKQLVALRKKAADVRAEEEAILELYKEAIGMQ